MTAPRPGTPPDLDTTTAGVQGKKATDPGGLYLQDHGNPVEYRNIWLIEQ